MKTAEEWSEYELGLLPATKIVLRLDGKTYADIIKQIQLDAWKQGMTDAAEIAGNEQGHTACHIRVEILTARDNKKTL
jgi:tRNA(His) 5'-end guanylyltransferase